MRKMEQRPLFMVRAGEDDLDALLAARGYDVVDPVTVLSAPITRPVFARTSSAASSDDPARKRTEQTDYDAMLATQRTNPNQAPSWPRPTWATTRSPYLGCAGPAPSHS